MRHSGSTSGDRQKAVIYCRVSGKKQTVDGSGLDSQEYRCRQYAAAKDYDVEAVFPDDITGGGDFMNRPGMVALLRYLDDHPEHDYVVIFDDLKRYARDVEFHLKLRRLMLERNATRECLNFNFEDTPEGKFNEIISAAAGELERLQMGRQNRQKSMARVEQGYWVFRAPVGYRYEKSPRGGKELVRDEPLAGIVAEALEGYASRRFTTQTEVKRFLEAQAAFPKDLPNGEIRQQTVVRLLGKIVYAGYVSAPSWGISERDGQHEGLISLETFQRIQDRLNGKTYAASRKDARKDFPLRGAIACAACGSHMTGGWSQGKYKKYPYYFCHKNGCSQFGKTIARRTIEGEFEALLKQMQPTRTLLNMAAAMFRDGWAVQREQAVAAARAVKREIAAIEGKIDQLVERVVDASNPRVIAAYEGRISGLEREKLILAEKAENPGQAVKSYEEMLELCLRFLSSPWKIWTSGEFEMRRLVLKLAFSEPLIYVRNEGFRTPKTTLPFKVLADFCGSKSKMVPQERIELSTSPLPRVRSTTELLRP